MVSAGTNYHVGNLPPRNQTTLMSHSGTFLSASDILLTAPMKKSCQDLEKNHGKIFSRSCKNLARNQAIQDFCMDLERESCKIRKILASSKSWHGFGTDFLPTCQILKRLGKILQDILVGKRQAKQGSSSYKGENDGA